MQHSAESKVAVEKNGGPPKIQGREGAVEGQKGLKSGRGKNRNFPSIVIVKKNEK
jgi:hypothetical protein